MLASSSSNSDSKLNETTALLSSSPTHRPTDSDPSSTIEEPATGMLNTNTIIHAGKMVGLVALAAVISATNAANAAASPSNTNPANMSFEWFGNLSTDLKAWTITYGGSSEAVNTIFNVDMMLLLGGIIMGFAAKAHKAKREKALLAFVTILALAAGLSSFGLGEDNFKFLKDDLFLIPAISFTLSTVISRMVGLDGIVTRNRNFLNPYAKQQSELVMALKHLKQDSKADVRELFEQVKQDLFSRKSHPTHKEFNDLFLGSLASTAQSDWFDHSTCVEKSLARTGKAFDLLMGITVGLATGIAFVQKGYTGNLDMAKLIDSDFGEAFANLDNSWKALAGLASGLGSFALYATRTYDFRSTLIDTFNHLKETGLRSPAFYAVVFSLSTLAVLNYYASGSGENLAKNILKSPSTEITPIQMDTLLGDIFIKLNRAGVFFVNYRSSIDLFHLRAPQTVNAGFTLEAYLRRLSSPTGVFIDADTIEAAKAIVSKSNPVNSAYGYELDPEKNPADMPRLSTALAPTVFSRSKSRDRDEAAQANLRLSH